MQIILFEAFIGEKKNEFLREFKWKNLKIPSSILKCKIKG